MKKLIQTRLHNPPKTFGNCFPTVLACLMDLNDPEEVIQIQEYYFTEPENWSSILYNWLEEKGFLWEPRRSSVWSGNYDKMCYKPNRRNCILWLDQ